MTNPLKEGALTENSVGIGTVTRGMVRERAVELALINGRTALEVTESDWEQARRELTGKPDTDPNEAALESAPESDRWDPVHGSTGHKVTVASSTVRIQCRGAATLHTALFRCGASGRRYGPDKYYRSVTLAGSGASVLQVRPPLVVH